MQTGFGSCRRRTVLLPRRAPLLPARRITIKRITKCANGNESLCIGHPLSCNSHQNSGHSRATAYMRHSTRYPAVGSAPTSVVTDPVFETGAASLYLPAFLKG